MSHKTDGALLSLARAMNRTCTRCNACVTRCGFLQEHGTPGDIAAAIQRGGMDQWPDPFGCSLCGLCGAVCPEGLRPEELFLAMRRELMESGQRSLRPYGPVLSYEKRGDSALFSLLRLPAGGDTVLFPGCALPGTRPETVRRLFTVLQTIVPDLGVSLACCLKPSHDLGRQSRFEARFSRVLDRMREAGVRQVITACPNCQKIFERYGGSVAARTAYELLADSRQAVQEQPARSAVIHDPCPQRHAPGVREAVRVLAGRCNVQVEDIREQGRLTRCCGEGGMVKFVRPDLAGGWTEQRAGQAGGRPLVTSCAGCVGYLKGAAPTSHILDLCLGTEDMPSPRPPLTYLARLRLKAWFMRRLSG